MTNSRCGTAVRLLLVFGLLVLAVTSWAQQRPPILEKLAKTYGIDSWDQVESIRYTWNGEITGLFKTSRTWTWEPKTNKVTYEGKDQDGKPVKVTYLRSELSSQPDAVKKESTLVSSTITIGFCSPSMLTGTPAPPSPIKACKNCRSALARPIWSSVKYPSEAGGYTPGDTWDLYVGKDNRIELLVFHHGGNAKPSLVTATWTGYKKAGPLLVSTEHRGTADGKPLHIFLTNVAVKLAGSNTWMDAK